MHVFLHSQRRCKDEIARELLAETNGKASDTPQGASDARRARSADAHGVTLGPESQDSEPSFCNANCETDVEMLTGDAEN